MRNQTKGLWALKIISEYTLYIFEITFIILEEILISIMAVVT